MHKSFNNKSLLVKGIWAKDEIRTRDPDLGKVVLYQLSYFRIFYFRKSLSRLRSANIDRNAYSARDKYKISHFCRSEWLIGIDYAA